MQLVRPEQGMRCLLESVHHDYAKRCRIINAWHAEGAEWTLTGKSLPRSQHWAMLCQTLLLQQAVLRVHA